MDEISIQEFKKLFFKIYGEEFVDGFRLFQTPSNIVYYGDFKLYDGYADEDIYKTLPGLNTLFEEEDDIYIYTDHAYRESNIFILKAKVISSFLEECCLDFFSNEPLFINLESDKAFGYCLEGPELDSGIFFQLDLKKLRENNKKKLKKDLTNILLKLSQSVGFFPEM